MTEIIQQRKLEAIQKASIAQLNSIDISLEKGDITETEAEFQQKIILEVLELQALELEEKSLCVA